MNSSLPTWLYLAPFLGALLCAATGWWIRGAARAIALAALAAMTCLALAGAGSVLESGRLHSYLGGWAPPIGIELALDPLSALMVALVSATAFAVLLGSGASVRAELEGRETAFHALALLMVAGMTGIAVTADLFNLFVHLEVASLSAYALTGTGRPGAARAGLNYLLIGSLGASLYLLGVGYLYAGTGSLNMADVAARLAGANPPLATIGAVLIAAGLAVKMALFPLHGWMPAAYSASPAAAAALMAPLVTKIAAYALLRIFFWVYAAEGAGARPLLLMDLVGWAGAAAVVFGGAMAFLQKDLRRLLAYSSVSQVGIVAIGVSVANASGLTGAILHLVNDGLMKAALFLAAGVALHRFGVSEVERLGVLRGRAPWLTVVFALAGVSLIGLPPLAGFFGKWHVLLGAAEAGRWGLVAAVLAGTAITAAYVFRILEPLLFARASGRDAPEENLREGPVAPVAVAVVFAGLLLLVGLLNGPLVAGWVRAALPGGL